MKRRTLKLDMKPSSSLTFLKYSSGYYFSGKKAIEKQLMESKSQLTEAKRKNEEEAEVITRLEENRKKSMKDLEELTHKLEEVQAANDKLEKSKRKY